MIGIDRRFGIGALVSCAALSAAAILAMSYFPASLASPSNPLAPGELSAGKWSIALMRDDGSIAAAIDPTIAAVLVLIALTALWLGPRLVSSFRLEPPLEDAAQASTQEVNEAVSEKLDQSLTTVLDLVHSTIAANGRYSDVLAKAESSLSSMVRPEDVKVAVQSLIVENTAIRSEVDSLKQRLEVAHVETQDLRSELMSAQKLMFVDNLTGLNNRRWFDSHFTSQVAAAQNTTPLCLAIGELDEFDTVNNTFGYQSGDRILSWIGSILLKNLRRGDSAIRFGGNCFALILPRKDLRQATEIVDSVLIELRKTHWVHKESGRDIGVLTGSFGLAQLRSDEGGDALLKRATANLSSARSSGRNRIVSAV